MKVILLKDLAKKGKKGDIIEVSDGYAQNYLIKNKYATQLTKQSAYINKSIERHKSLKDENNRKNAEDIFSKIDNSNIIVKVKTNDEDRIFGAITSNKIIKILEETKKVKVNKKNFMYFKSFTSLGKHNLELKLYKDIIAKLTIELVKE